MVSYIRKAKFQGNTALPQGDLLRAAAKGRKRLEQNELVMDRKKLTPIIEHGLNAWPNEALLILRFKRNELLSAMPVKRFDESPISPGIPDFNFLREISWNDGEWFALIHSHPADKLPRGHHGDRIIQEQVLREAGLPTAGINGTFVLPITLPRACLGDVFASIWFKDRMSNEEKTKVINKFLEKASEYIGLYKVENGERIQLLIK